MRKLIAIAGLFILTSFDSSTTYVYLCDSQVGKKYHYAESCRGLNACTHKIIKVTLEEAKEKEHSIKVNYVCTRH